MCNERADAAVREWHLSVCQLRAGRHPARTFFFIEWIVSNAKVYKIQSVYDQRIIHRWIDRSALC